MLPAALEFHPLARFLLLSPITPALIRRPVLGRSDRRGTYCVPCLWGAFSVNNAEYAPRRPGVGGYGAKNDSTVTAAPGAPSYGSDHARGGGCWAAERPGPTAGQRKRTRTYCWAAERDPNWPFGPEAVSPAASSASVVYWAPRSLPKPNPPFSRFRVAVHLAAPGPKRLAALASALTRSRGGQPSPASQPRAELWGEIYRASKRCQPSKSLLYVCIVPPDRRKSPKVITERSQMRDREQQPSQWRWPRPEAPRARPRPRARAPDRPGRPRWPRR